jgi:hypothetical protein
MDGWYGPVQGCTNFPELYEPLRNSRRQKGDTKQGRRPEHPNMCLLKKLRGGERYSSIVDDQIILTGKFLPIFGVNSDWIY